MQATTEQASWTKPGRPKWAKRTLDGVRYYKTSTQIPVMVLLYPADPAKNPRFHQGMKWLAEESSGYPGGLTGPKWLQEMEGRFDVRDTARVFPWIDTRIQEITCKPYDLRQDRDITIICGYDYGYPSPSALLAFAFYGRKRVVQFDEIYGTLTMHQVVEEAKQRWWWERVRTIYADPAIWARTQQTEYGEPTSIASIFEDQYRIHMQKGQNFVGSDAAYVNLLDSVLWLKDNVKFQITENCVNTIKEYRLMAWRKESKTTDMDRPLQQVASKNVHAFDAGKYVNLEYWQGTSVPKAASNEDSIMWHLREMQRIKQSAHYVME